MAERQVIGPSSPKQEMMLNVDTDIAIIGGAAGCQPASAEFLTPRGWKRISEYTEGDYVAQFDSETDRLSFVKPIKYIKEECKTFKRMRARGLDFILTPEHRVLYYNTDNSLKPKVITFSEVVNRHESSVTKGWTGAIKTTFTPDMEGFKLNGELVCSDMLRLFVAIQADGSVGKGKKIYIRFSKDRKDKRLRDILDSLQIPYTRKEQACTRYSNGKAIEYSFYLAYAPKHFDDFWVCNREQLEVIVEEFPLWDGSSVENQSGKTIRYSNNNKRDVDFIQYACHACGYNTSLVQDLRHEKYTREHWCVNATKRGRGFRRFSNKDGKCNVEEYPSEDGFKYCFQVPSTFFLTRQNGKVFITGNSGKSFIGVLHPLKHAHDPWFRGVIFRKTNAEILAQGGLWENALEIYRTLYGRDKIKVHLKDMKITFPSGGSLKFSYLESDADLSKHQGAQYSFVLFDEGTHFSKRQTEYIIGRVRSARAKHRRQVIITCNPDPDWFALDWIKPYLDEEGTPNPDMDGVVRYFIKDELNNYHWSDDEEELNKRFNKRKGIDGATSFTFISANCRDNIPLMEANPGYEARLKANDWVDVQRLFLGNWFARPSSSGFYKREWVNEINDPPPPEEIVRIVRAYDLAGTLKSDSNPDPDYTASVKMAKTRSGQYVILEVERLRGRFYDIQEYIINKAHQDGKMVEIIIPQDPGAAGKQASGMLVRAIIEEGFTAVRKNTNSNKVDRFRPFAAMAQEGGIEILKSCSYDLENKIEGDNNFFHAELESFEARRSRKHDDMVDAVGDAFVVLATRQSIPTIDLSIMPNMSLGRF